MANFFLMRRDDVQNIYFKKCMEIWGLLHTTFTAEKNSGYFNPSFLPMVKSMVNSCYPEFSGFTRAFSPVKVLCNGPLERLQK